MKVWYNKKSKSRYFEPGGRVLVLFLVIGIPLQAKYFVPYEVVKKIIDTNYLVSKEIQVCHINMLKAYMYHEKPKPELVTCNSKLGLENPTPVLVRIESESCVEIETEKEEDTESEVRFMKSPTTQKAEKLTDFE